MASKQEPIRHTKKSAKTAAQRAGATQVSRSYDVDDTGERDVTYDLVSVLYHALQGAETVAKYLRDAQQEGDREILEFFEDIRDEDTDRAARARQLLLDRWADAEDEEDDEDEEGEDDEVEPKQDDAWSDY
jgi:hypothetical protein